MYVLQAKIEIGDYVFNQVHDVTVTKSVDLLSDTAEIKMPMTALFGNKEVGFERKQLEQEIKSGDKVKITLGYKNVIETVEFEGYVRWIKPNTPTITIECEDAVYLIRQKQITKNFGKTNLITVLQYIVEGTGVALAADVPEVNFDKFLLKNVNGAEALEKLKDEYGLSIYIDDNNTLFAGLRQSKNSADSQVYNIYKNIVSHDLKFRRAEDVRIALKVVGILKDNSKVEVLVGDTSGEQRTLHKYNISDKAQLKAIGEAELNDLKFTGYEGTITSFLDPFCTRGFNAQIIDKNYPEREGSYFVPKVVTTYGTGGARRKIELGTKVT